VARRATRPIRSHGPGPPRAVATPFPFLDFANIAHFFLISRFPICYFNPLIFK
jgi:hypothetical protein